MRLRMPIVSRCVQRSCGAILVAEARVLGVADGSGGDIPGRISTDR